ncbi:MAG TPA: HAD-IIB family hydrolase [Blastocatellia bacterium]|nr:HAD-IIB family hydrolase [Blastocatellia bacterium]
MGEPQLVIFTDLDGTLLDLKTYSYLPAIEALGRIIRRGVPLVFCSSKTRVEQQYYQERIGIREPMIVENGSAIVIPENYFAHPYAPRQTADGHDVIELGESAERIKGALDAVRRETRARFKALGEIPLEELCRLADLDPPAAHRAQSREYSETIVCEMSAEEIGSFLEALQARGLSCIGGSRFHTVVSSNVDKGRAVKLVTSLFRTEFGDVLTAGIGDSANDEPMLATVDLPYLLQSPDGHWKDISLVDVARVEGDGPAAWNGVVCRLLE